MQADCTEHSADSDHAPLNVYDTHSDAGATTHSHSARDARVLEAA